MGAATAQITCVVRHHHPSAGAGRRGTLSLTTLAAATIALLSAPCTLALEPSGRPTLCQRACSVPCHGKATLSCACVSDCVSRTIRTIKSGACGKEPKVDVIDEHHSQLNNKARVTAVCNNRTQAFPTLFVLGGQKCGSTTLFHDALKAIPALMQPSRHANEATYFGKELHFFDQPERFAQGSALYSSYYPPCDDVRKKGRIPIEGTPNYFLAATRPGEDVPDAWDLAHEFFKAELTPVSDANSAELRGEGLAFVVIVRDPSARYISGFNHFCIRELRKRNSSTSTCEPHYHLDTAT